MLNKTATRGAVFQKPINKTQESFNKNQNPIFVDSTEVKTHEQSVNIININFFFDGTGNNLINSELGKICRKSRDLSEFTVLGKEVKKLNKFYKEKKFKIVSSFSDGDIKDFDVECVDDTSFFDDYSNVGFIFKELDDEKDYSIYIGGCGTSHSENDDIFMGNAFAWGTNGRRYKINEAFKLLDTRVCSKEFIKNLDNKVIYFNFFGFSRGSFLTRHFYYELKKVITDYKQCDDEYENVKEFAEKIKNYKFNSMCVFDTVPSEGIKHSNDIKDYNLDDSYEGMYVLHLVAQDEFRTQFELAAIKNSVKSNIGIELSLPGVHSDVGGGYAEVLVEREKKLSDALFSKNVFGGCKFIHCSWYINKGYYHLNSKGNFYKYSELERITDDKELNGALYLDGDKVCIYKREVKNTYQYAVLYSILDFIQSYMFIPLRKSTLLKIKNKINEENLISKYANDLREWVNSKISIYSIPREEREFHHYREYYLPLTRGFSNKEMRQIYSRYIHNSRYEGYNLFIGDFWSGSVDCPYIQFDYLKVKNIRENERKNEEFKNLQKEHSFLEYDYLKVYESFDRIFVNQEWTPILSPSLEIEEASRIYMNAMECCSSNKLYNIMNLDRLRELEDISFGTKDSLVLLDALFLGYDNLKMISNEYSILYENNAERELRLGLFNLLYGINDNDYSSINETLDIGKNSEHYNLIIKLLSKLRDVQFVKVIRNELKYY